MRNQQRTRALGRLVAVALAIITLVALVLVGSGVLDVRPTAGPAASAPASSGPPTTRTPATSVTVSATVAVDPTGLLAQLVIATEDTDAPYERPEWGEDWKTHADGCTTREQILLRDSGGKAVPAEDCTPVCPPKLITPCWVSPYDGARHRHRDGLQIDHVVAPKEASRSRVINPDGSVGVGAGRVWTAQQRHGFYEDQRNLLAVTSAVNGSKGDDDPGRWRPALDSAWCQVATMTATMKIDYRLSVDQAEHDALGQMLATCPAGAR